MKVDRGTGVWDASGGLVHYIKSGADLTWSRDWSALLSLEVRFGPCAQQKGVRHALRIVDPASFETLDEIEICIPTGSVEYIVLSHRGDKCLATWLEQNQWGYVMVDLKSMTQLPFGFDWPSANLAPPEFSLDDAFIVSCSGFRTGWWTDEVDDYWEYPSPGGLRKVGTVSVHDVASATLTNHDVLVDLPPGWLPDRPDQPEWDTIWGPEFVSERRFRIWLPDDSTELLELPLPPRIEIKRQIATERPRLDD
jgi:hypothetical protein